MTSITGNYPTPVQVNGFTCKNCTDVAYAQKHIDPAHPKSGPYDINAATDPSRQLTEDTTGADAAKPGSALAASTGTQLDLSV